jgi:hypothetical protein
MSIPTKGVSYKGPETARAKTVQPDELPKQRPGAVTYAKGSREHDEGYLPKMQAKREKARRPSRGGKR